MAKNWSSILQLFFYFIFILTLGGGGYVWLMLPWYCYFPLNFWLKFWLKGQLFVDSAVSIREAHTHIHTHPMSKLIFFFGLLVIWPACDFDLLNRLHRKEILFFSCLTRLCDEEAAGRGVNHSPFNVRACFFVWEVVMSWLAWFMIKTKTKTMAQSKQEETLLATHDSLLSY